MFKNQKFKDISLKTFVLSNAVATFTLQTIANLIGHQPLLNNIENVLSFIFFFTLAELFIQHYSK